MTTRIFFNGREYPSVEAMPDEVRKVVWKCGGIAGAAAETLDK